MKNYFEVTAIFDKEGGITPIAVKMDDKKLEVDRVLDATTHSSRGIGSRWASEAPSNLACLH